MRLPRSGILVVIGMFVLGLAVMTGFFLAPRGKAPATQPTTSASLPVP